MEIKKYLEQEHKNHKKKVIEHIKSINQQYISIISDNPKAIGIIRTKIGLLERHLSELSVYTDLLTWYKKADLTK